MYQTTISTDIQNKQFISSSSFERVLFIHCYRPN